MEALKVFANKFEQFKEEELKPCDLDGEVLSYALDALKFNEIYRETQEDISRYQCYPKLEFLKTVGKR